MNKYSFWFKSAGILQLITAGLHSLSFIKKPEGQNESEKQLIDLMMTCQMDMGAGIQRTFYEIFISVSACVTLICLFGGLLNLYLVRQALPIGTIKGVININILIFGVATIIMFFFAFLPPLVCFALIFISLVISRLLIK